MQNVFHIAADGLAALTYWRFWAIALSMSVVSRVPLVLTGSLVDKKPELGSWAISLVSFWPPVVMATTIGLLVPIMIFHNDIVGWSVLKQLSYWQLLLLVGVPLVAALSLEKIVPIVGYHVGLLASSAAVLGLFTYFVSAGQMIVLPDHLLAYLGLVALGGLVYALFTLLFALLMTALNSIERDFSHLLFLQLLGMVPVLTAMTIYAGWIRDANGL